MLRCNLRSSRGGSAQSTDERRRHMTVLERAVVEYEPRRASCSGPPSKASCCFDLMGPVGQADLLDPDVARASETNQRRILNPMQYPDMTSSSSTCFKKYVSFVMGLCVCVSVEHTPCLRKNCTNLSFAHYLSNMNRFQS